MPDEENNLSFAEFGVEHTEKRIAIGAPKRTFNDGGVSRVVAMASADPTEGTASARSQ